jgi:hypothetical protein
VGYFGVVGVGFGVEGFGLVGFGVVGVGVVGVGVVGVEFVFGLIPIYYEFK